MEPTLEEIDDFNGNESEEKRKTVYKVIMLCLAIGALYTAAKLTFNTVDDYIGPDSNQARMGVMEGLH